MFRPIAVAAEALGEIGSDQTAKHLIKALKYWPRDWPRQGNRPEDYSASISKALKKITEQDFGDNYYAWIEWYEKTEK